MKCSICGKPILGIERLANITTRGGNRAHFYCYYPNGTKDDPLELPAWAIDEIAQRDSNLASNFRRSKK